MNIVADTHIHFYPCYDVKRAVRTLRLNLADSGKNSLSMAFLAERYDCHFFKELKEFGTTRAGFEAMVEDHGEALLIREEGFQDLYLFAGRQVITAERLEVLALTTDKEIVDGMPVRDVIQLVNHEGALAVLSWAPGKWFGKRGNIVARLMEDLAKDEMLLGDTTLRPWCWLEPLLMRRGRKLGFKVLAGSDPLPFSGEEKQMGKYLSRWSMVFDKNNPVESIRNFLKNTESTPETIGDRGSCFETLMRLYNNKKSK